MELLVYYSHNHRCYKTRFGYVPYGQDIGHINGFNEELMLYTVSKGFTLSIRNRFIRFLKDIVDKLEHPYRKN